jgi:hypothetical protein
MMRPILTVLVEDPPAGVAALLAPADIRARRQPASIGLVAR